METKLVDYEPESIICDIDQKLRYQLSDVLDGVDLLGRVGAPFGQLRVARQLQRKAVSLENKNKFIS